MFNFNSPLPLALALAAASVLIVTPVALAQSHAGHTMPVPAATNIKSVGVLPITATKASIVAVPPVIKETSAFVTLKNTSKQAIKLMSVSAPIASQAMLMHTIKSQNMSGMVPAPLLTIPAGGTLVLKNDGDHIMLMKLKRALKVGEVLPITLTAADGRTLTIKATVQKP